MQATLGRDPLVRTLAAGGMPRVVGAVKSAEPAKAETGRVDCTVRPYASVYVSGTLLGVTPFARNRRKTFWYGRAPFALR